MNYMSNFVIDTKSKISLTEEFKINVEWMYYTFLTWVLYVKYN